LAVQVGLVRGVPGSGPRRLHWGFELIRFMINARWFSAVRLCLLRRWGGTTLTIKA